MEGFTWGPRCLPDCNDVGLLDREASWATKNHRRRLQPAPAGPVSRTNKQEQEAVKEVASEYQSLSYFLICLLLGSMEN